MRPNLTARRLALQLSQSELAERAGTSQAAIAKAERGQSAPSGPSLARLCELLSLTPAELLDTTPRSDEARQIATDGTRRIRRPRAKRPTSEAA